MPNKIVARVSSVMIIVAIIASLLILVTDGISLKWLILFLGFIFILFYYNKIELDNSTLIIKSFLPFIIVNMFPSIYFNKIIDVNNIISVKFSSYLLYFFGIAMGNSITVYYTSSSGEKSNFTVPLFIYPEFKTIAEKILERKPEIKIF